MSRSRSKRKRLRKKNCTQCGKPKRLEEFHRRALSTDGRRSECAVCGRERATRYYQRNRAKKIQSTLLRRHETLMWVRQIKAAEGCIHCGELCEVCLDFHHRDPKKKAHSINEMVRRGFSKENILEEIEKCDVVCSNCHRKLHDVHYEWNS